MKNDLISRDALGVDFCSPDVFESKAYAAGWNSLIKIIKTAPAVDAVEVVRCKDCMARGRSFHCPMMYLGFYPPDDWYCPEGRKEAQKDD